MSNWQRAFVLHSRPYSETSLLVDLFVEQAGRVTVLAKGARRKRSAQKGSLQPFTPLIVQYSGSGSLKTLRQVEAISLALPLSGTSLYSAFYLNELVHRVIVAESDTTSLFLEYLNCLQSLALQQRSPEHALRRFELALLDNLGYTVDFIHCSATGDDVADEMTYQYRAEKGFIGSLITDNYSFTGRQLKSLAAKEFPDGECLKAAKRFTRIALKPYTGSQPFKSRELFRK
ncbi:DNA repair protein RecO [Zophobihabitans entericus]|uniref:DNA repair protein RecO n=1 Tax=Zophobihabitans entericus TaxID=1635327 RepID=A0A6G9IC37_9GAMM|nr:DNA repair protein RecO [Zophobihabitans entericus]QIQ21796.1 DNA repair protein RecO [Zophobihabitans entericus]